ncbi:uncharacterized protein LOC123515072 [Portunus trituberculatus]|uniref:uncharacterized protein LOC123515072 n=1 Tax=Portunus trituberculatus TaxID=210409 RepID=UPI001E1CF58A|nr:uncharacterized protein LOC123515072 [Portunus trituberculatus]
MKSVFQRKYARGGLRSPPHHPTLSPASTQRPLHYSSRARCGDSIQALKEGCVLGCVSKPSPLPKYPLGRPAEAGSPSQQPARSACHLPLANETSGSNVTT